MGGKKKIKVDRNLSGKTLKFPKKYFSVAGFILIDSCFRPSWADKQEWQSIYLAVPRQQISECCVKTIDVKFLIIQQNFRISPLNLRQGGSSTLYWQKRVWVNKQLNQKNYFINFIFLLEYSSKLFINLSQLVISLNNSDLAKMPRRKGLFLNNLCQYLQYHLELNLFYLKTYI